MQQAITCKTKKEQRIIGGFDQRRSHQPATKADTAGASPSIQQRNPRAQQEPHLD
jgi:hypothetical protein